MLSFARELRMFPERCPLRRALMIFVFLLVVFWTFSIVVPAPARASSPTPLASTLADNFTRDTALNTNLWTIDGPVGLAFGSLNCPSCTNVTLAPSFSSAGMEIAQINGSSEVGTIQSTGTFTPPFTVTAIVEGAVSDGHPFVFGVTTADASSGVQVTGNLNPNDCSNETNCGDPATCGNPANPAIPAGQCFYGIYARTGTGGGHWVKSPFLVAKPSVDVVYTLEISVDSSGTALFNVSQSGQVLTSSTGSVGTGPFYLIIAQSEGAPVPGPGPNAAYWLSVSVVPTAPSPGPTPSGSSSGLSSVEWLLIVLVVIAVLVAIVILRRRGGRSLTVRVVDSGNLTPVAGAGVTADGPARLTGSTGVDGRVAFASVKSGDYSVQAGADGFAPSSPARVPVQRATEHTVRLDRAPAPSPTTPVTVTPSPAPLSPPPTMSAPAAPATRPVPEPASPRAAPPPSEPTDLEDMGGWAGERMREIVATFRAKGAISPETALTAEELGLSRMFVRIMRRRRGKTRVFVEVNGRYYLDESALHQVK